MENIKLLQRLSKLSKQELISFGMFIKTPSFNRNQKIVALFEALLPYAPKFNAAKIDARLIYQQIFPKKSFHNIQFNHLCSLLTTSCQHFFAAIALKKEEYSRERLLLQQYDNIKYNEHFRLECQNFKNHLVQKQPFGLFAHFHDFWLERATYYHVGNNKKERKKNEATLKAAFHKLDQFYQLARLELICEMANKISVNTNQFESSYFDLSFLPSNIRKQEDLSPDGNVIELYYFLFKIIHQREVPPNSLEMVNRLFQHLPQLNMQPKSKDIILSYLFNFISRASKKYPLKAKNLYLEIMQIRLAKGEFLHNGYINTTTFINLIFMAFGINKVGTMYALRYQYTDKLQPKDKEATILLADAAIAYRTGQFKQCINLLLQNNKQSLPHKIHIELLLIRAYYEQILLEDKSAPTVFEHSIKRYKKYLQYSTVLPVKFRESHILFLQNIQTLLLHHQKKDMTALTLFKNKIQASNTGLKLWLYEQIDLLNTKLSANPPPRKQP